MPSLLELPPELIQQIYDSYQCTWYLHQMGSLRLTCRYIEKAVRRSFRLSYFNHQVIRPEEDSIERFCALAKIPDLAKSVTSIKFMACDDAMTCEEKAKNICHGVQVTSVDPPAIALPDQLARLLPTTLLTHSGALLAALVATENVTHVAFRDNYEMPTFRFSSAPSDDHFWNVTATVDFVLLLMTRAARLPKSIVTAPFDDSPRTGLIDASILVTRKPSLLKLESLQLSFINPPDWRLRETA